MISCHTFRGYPSEVQDRSTFAKRDIPPIGPQSTRSARPAGTGPSSYRIQPRKIFTRLIGSIIRNVANRAVSRSHTVVKHGGQISFPPGCPKVQDSRHATHPGLSHGTTTTHRLPYHRQNTQFHQGGRYPGICAILHYGTDQAAGNRAPCSPVRTRARPRPAHRVRGKTPALRRTAHHTDRGGDRRHARGPVPGRPLDDRRGRGLHHLPPVRCGRVLPPPPPRGPAVASRLPHRQRLPRVTHPRRARHRCPPTTPPA